MKRIFQIIFVYLFTLTLCAEPVTKQQASSIASKFFDSHGLTFDRKSPVMMAPGRGNAPASTSPYYVFNAKGNKGFAIVSGDDRTPEILGYSTSGSFNLDDAPENVRAWLDEYARQIEYIQKNNIQSAPSATATSDRATISPMLQTKWNQTYPYNETCPTMTSSGWKYTAATGCVATAMAQVLYYQYQQHPNAIPLKLTADIPAYKYKLNGITQDIDGIQASTSSIDWSNMLLDYGDLGSYTDEQLYAVARLMEYCGKSVKMRYDRASSASYPDVPEAFAKYFGISPSVRYIVRDNYSTNEWLDVIYNELQNNRPVLYAGRQQYSDGHAFVINGYEGNSYFDINWGWSGLCDGAYLLYTLNPEEQGTGGASGKYNYDQRAIIGIEPGTKASEEFRISALQLTTDSTRRSYSYIYYYPVNTGSKEVDVEYGFALLADNGDLSLIDGTLKRDTIAPGTKDSNFNLGEWNYIIPKDIATFASAGTYTIVPVGRVYGTTAWQRLLPVSNDIKMTVGLDGKISYSQKPINKLYVSDFVLPDKVYSSGYIAAKKGDVTANNIVSFTLNNPTDWPCKGTLYIGNSNSSVDFDADANSRQTITTTFTTDRGNTDSYLNVYLDKQSSVSLGQSETFFVQSPYEVFINGPSIGSENGKLQFKAVLRSSSYTSSYNDTLFVKLWKVDGSATTLIRTEKIKIEADNTLDTVRMDLSGLTGTYRIMLLYKPYPFSTDLVEFYNSKDFYIGLSVSNIQVEDLIVANKETTVTASVTNTGSETFNGKLSLFYRYSESSIYFNELATTKTLNIAPGETKQVSFKFIVYNATTISLYVGNAINDGYMVLARKDDFKSMEKNRLDISSNLVVDPMAQATEVKITLVNSAQDHAFIDPLHIRLRKAGYSGDADFILELVIDTLNIAYGERRNLSVTLPALGDDRYIITFDAPELPHSTSLTTLISSCTFDKKLVASNLVAPSTTIVGETSKLTFDLTNNGTESFSDYLSVATDVDYFGTILTESKTKTVDPGATQSDAISWKPSSKGENDVYLARSYYEGGDLVSTIVVLGHFPTVHVKEANNIRVSTTHDVYGNVPSTSISITVKNNSEEDFIDKLYIRLSKENIETGKYVDVSEVVTDELNIHSGDSKDLTVELPTSEIGNYIATIDYYRTPTSSSREKAAECNICVLNKYTADLTDNGGTITSTFGTSSEDLAKIIDDDPSTVCFIRFQGSIGDDNWLQYESSEKLLVTSYSITIPNTDIVYNVLPTSWYLYGSNDGVNWTELDRRENYNFGFSKYLKRDFEIEASKVAPYKFIRLNVTGTTYGWSSWETFPIAEWQLYGSVVSPTGIGTVSTVSGSTMVKVYSVSGSYIGTVTSAEVSGFLKTLPRGIYIVNGRKVAN